MSEVWTVAGNPTPEELAAAVAVLSAQPALVEEEPEPVVSRWSTRSEQMRHPLPHGPGAWKAGVS